MCLKTITHRYSRPIHQTKPLTAWKVMVLAKRRLGTPDPPELAFELQWRRCILRAGRWMDGGRGKIRMREYTRKGHRDRFYLKGFHVFANRQGAVGYVRKEEPSGKGYFVVPVQVRYVHTIGTQYGRTTKVLVAHKLFVARAEKMKAEGKV